MCHWCHKNTKCSLQQPGKPADTARPAAYIRQAERNARPPHQPNDYPHLGYSTRGSGTACTRPVGAPRIHRTVSAWARIAASAGCVWRQVLGWRARSAWCPMRRCGDGGRKCRRPRREAGMAADQLASPEM